jgi:hypothetical protein
MANVAVDWKRAQKKAATTARWAVTMTKVRIRQALARTRWQLVTFCGGAGGESVGVVDLIAVRKDHCLLLPGAKRGDRLQIILIQVKGGKAAMPTEEDGHRLRIVARHHRAQQVLLATWNKGTAARFFRLRNRGGKGLRDWIEVKDLNSIFR